MSFRDLLHANRRVGGLLRSTALAVLVAAPGGVTADAAASAADVDAPAPPAAAAQGSYADVLTRVTPAVVTVRASRRAREARQFPFMDDPELRELFGERFRQQNPRPEER